MEEEWGGPLEAAASEVRAPTPELEFSSKIDLPPLPEFFSGQSSKFEALEEEMSTLPPEELATGDGQISFDPAFLGALEEDRMPQQNSLEEIVQLDRPTNHFLQEQIQHANQDPNTFYNTVDRVQQIFSDCRDLPYAWRPHFKTVLCPSLFDRKKCEKQDCKGAHNLTTVYAANKVLNKKYKQQPCHYQPNCKKREYCPYRHSGEPHPDRAEFGKQPSSFSLREHWGSHHSMGAGSYTYRPKKSYQPTPFGQSRAQITGNWQVKNQNRSPSTK